ncbi:hypothetical protein [Actinacidiphila sp. ITFR-21]|uniref:hypothetical protein n=1 Tax=Actinacidiphila sp. ITFR-21 TaxID=3075199 RepID=UPI0028898806|nr:hypothetical protein [Streptomyces sp. ITFR-21]WNI15595.1 hypothetical protein RLT57_08670 [Streptomyces sp. ITFR-21]
MNPQNTHRATGTLRPVSPDVPGIPDHVLSSLRRTYPRGYAALEKAIAEAPGETGLQRVADIEVHADHLLLRTDSGDAVREIPFDVSNITPRGGTFDLLLDRDQQTVFILSGHDTGALTPALKGRLLDVLRPHYWLVEGAKEPAANPFLFGTREIREFLSSLLEEPAVGVIHPHIQAVAQAMSRGEYLGASEFVQSLQRASLELRRSGLDPALQRRLETVARTTAQLRRGFQPVLAIRKVTRPAILETLGVDDAKSLRQTLSKPEVLSRLIPSHAIDTESIGSMDLARLLELVEELREYEFCDIFLVDRTPEPRPGTIGATMRREGMEVSPLSTPDNLGEAMKLIHSLSRASSFLFSREQSRRMNIAVQDHLPKAGRDHIVGFFPGLGSRASYQNLGRSLLDSGIPDVVRIYQDCARALGFPGRPEKLLLVPENMPEGKMEQQGFIGAALLVHSLALEAHLRAGAQESGAPVNFVAYTGESFGVITSAVASGSISFGDGAKIAQAFTPLMLVAAEGEAPDEPFARKIATYLPDSLKGQKLVPEPSHVVGLQADPEDLAEALEDIERSYPKTDVEVHKTYSLRQTNIYVRTGVKSDFDRFMRKFPAVRMEELKAPTKFLAHSERMTGVRQALERFIEKNNIVFRKPHTPVVSNNNAGLLTTAAEVRSGVLAITNEIMASRTTVETLASLHPDMILELGLGNKSVQLLTDNNVEAPVLAYTGAPDETDLFLRAVKLVDGLMEELGRLHTSGSRLAAQHYGTLRGLFRLASKSPFYERYFHRTMGRVITNEMLHSERDGSPAFYRFLEIFQHTYNHRGSILPDQGELVLQARLKKRIVGHPERLGQVYAELQVINGTGDVADRSSINIRQPEVVVFHFDRLADLGYADLARKTRLLLDTQPLARQIYDQMLESLRIEDDGFLTLAGTTVPTVDQMAMSHIVYQYTLFHILHLYRPAMFAQNDYYLEGSDPMGWLVALAASGAVTLPDIVKLYGAYLRAGADTDGVQAALDRMLSALKKSDVPVISPEGIPLQSKKDLEAATRAVFR